MRGNRKIMAVVAVAMCLWLIAACKPGTPSRFIQPDDMEDILVDYHLARAIARNSDLPYDSVTFYQALYVEGVFHKYGITADDFDSSMVYYYTHAERFEPIYKRVAARLEDRALALGATEGEIGVYAQLNATGDTANIWAERSRMAMMPIPPYNRWDFEVEVDSTFRRGDRFTLQFRCNYVYQDGSKSGVVYLAVGYENDTIITRNVHFLTTGMSRLDIPAYDDADIRSIRGFFYLGDGNKRSTTTRLLFLSNVQLIRFHNQKKDEENKKDSLSQDSVSTDTLVIDALSGRDSVGRGMQMLSVDTGATIDRMAVRRHPRETRR